MKKHLFLVAPLALTALLACGSNKKSEITFDDASNFTANYRKNINNDTRAKDVHVTGDINSFTFEGDLAIKGYVHPKTGGTRRVDIDLKDSSFSIAKQRLVDTDVPVSLLNAYIPPSLRIKTRAMNSKNLMTMMSRKKKVYLIMATFATLPMNERLLLLFEGCRLKEQVGEGEFPLEKDPWLTIESKYYMVGNKFRIETKTDDLFRSVEEIAKHFGDKEVSIPCETKVPLSLALTFSDLGYVEEFSLSCATPGRIQIDSDEAINKSKKRNVFKMNASASIDFTLHLERTFYKSVVVNYQVNLYTAKEIEEHSGNYKLEKGESLPISQRIEDFSQYFDVQWYDYYESAPAQKPIGMTRDGGVTMENEEYFDDPISCINYWRNRDKNIAFEFDNYDVLIVPKGRRQILGVDASKVFSNIRNGYKMEIPNDLSNVSYNGQIISESTIDGPTEVPFIMSHTADTIPGQQEPVTVFGSANLYIPAIYMKDTNGRYIVSISVLDLPPEPVLK